MKCGVGRDIITPDVEAHMGGYGSLYGRHFEGIHDDLYVKALLMDDGRRRVMLISLDLLMHDYALTETVADYIASRHGIDRDHVTVAYTHTHAGPAIEGYDPGQSSERYEEFLLERIKSAVDRACVNTFEGRISFGAVRGDWNMNRRKLVDGQMQNAPNPDGPRDDVLNILAIRDAQGQPKVLLLNYACHPVTLGATSWISSEYPGRLCQLLDTRLYGTTSVFFQGAGGNARPRIAASGDRWKQCTFDEVDAMAESMASRVLGAIDSGELAPMELNLAAKQFVVQLETEVYPKAFFESVVNNSELPEGSAKNEARRVLDTYDTRDNLISLHAGIVRLSDELYIAFLCGEVCFEVKQHIEKAFEGKKLIFIGYGDGTAYIPDDKILAEGGYEADGSVVEFCLKGKLKPGIDRKMRDAYRKHLELL